MGIAHREVEMADGKIQYARCHVMLEKKKDSFKGHMRKREGMC